MAAREMEVMPAIDLLGDDAVRLHQGDYARVTGHWAPTELAGPDVALVRRVAKGSSIPVLAAGGIRSEADIEALAGAGAEGAIVGRALLEGRFVSSALSRRA